MELRRWLSKHQPKKLKCEYADGEEKTIRVNDTRSRWRDAAEACGAPIRVEGITDDGETLAVWEDENAAVVAEEQQQTKEGQTAIELARIITSSNDQAVLRYAEIMRLAFDQNAALVAVLSNRLAALEKAWHGLLMSQKPDDASADPNANLVQTLLLMAAGGGIPTTPPAASSNGKE